MARCVFAAFRVYLRRFQKITHRAHRRFEQRDWRGNQRDAEQRLDLYAAVVDRVLHLLQQRLGDRGTDIVLWRRVKRCYAELAATRENPELARTFYNSVSRRLFGTVGVRPEIEFVSLEPAVELLKPDTAIYRRVENRGSLTHAFREVLDGLPLQLADVPRDARAVARQVRRYLRSLLGPHPVDAVEVLRPLFFRHNGAFVVGRIQSRAVLVPLVMALRHDDRGIVVDAVLMSQDEVSILFSFARSYFHVDAPQPSELIRFLKSLVPLKPIAELYISLGFHKQGKTERYRDLRRHLGQSGDRFSVAAGDAGMVMLVFTLSNYDLVFKVIRDRFAHPKEHTRAQVVERYHLVFRHDRVGRLVDAQEFRQLIFRRHSFEPTLLRELLTEAAGTVSVQGDDVVIGHLYTERKLEPLNLYLRRADAEAAAHAVIDYGNAIKELAAANIFPGDFLLKNFGVTRHGRVVFYDYDELCLLTDCRFRRMPPPRTPEEEMEAEPWFTVGPADIFPEEFARFLGLPADLREVFVRHHGDLFTVEFWRELQDSQRRGEIPEIFGYPPQRRLPRDDPGPASASS